MRLSKYYSKERGDNIWSTPNGVVAARTTVLAGGIYFFEVAFNERPLSMELMLLNKLIN